MYRRSRFPHVQTVCEGLTKEEERLLRKANVSFTLTADLEKYASVKKEEFILLEEATEMAILETNTRECLSFVINESRTLKFCLEVNLFEDVLSCFLAISEVVSALLAKMQLCLALDAQKGCERENEVHPALPSASPIVDDAERNMISEILYAWLEGPQLADVPVPLRFQKSDGEKSEGGTPLPRRGSRSRLSRAASLNDVDSYSDERKGELLYSDANAALSASDEENKEADLHGSGSAQSLLPASRGFGSTLDMTAIDENFDGLMDSLDGVSYLAREYLTEELFKQFRLIPFPDTELQCNMLEIAVHITPLQRIWDEFCLYRERDFKFMENRAWGDMDDVTDGPLAREEMVLEQEIELDLYVGDFKVVGGKLLRRAPHDLAILSSTMQAFSLSMVALAWEAHLSSFAMRIRDILEFVRRKQGSVTLEVFLNLLQTSDDVVLPYLRVCLDHLTPDEVTELAELFYTTILAEEVENIKKLVVDKIHIVCMEQVSTETHILQTESEKMRVVRIQPVSSRALGPSLHTSEYPRAVSRPAVEMCDAIQYLMPLLTHDALRDEFHGMPDLIEEHFTPYTEELSAYLNGVHASWETAGAEWENTEYNTATIISTCIFLKGQLVSFVNLLSSVQLQSAGGIGKGDGDDSDDAGQNGFKGLRRGSQSSVTSVGSDSGRDESESPAVSPPLSSRRKSAKAGSRRSSIRPKALYVDDEPNHHPLHRFLDHLDEMVVRGTRMLIQRHVHHLRTSILMSLHTSEEFQWNRQRLDTFEVERPSNALMAFNLYVRGLLFDLHEVSPPLVQLHVVSQVLLVSAYSVFLRYVGIRPSRARSLQYQVDLLYSIRVVRSFLSFLVSLTGFTEPLLGNPMDSDHMQKVRDGSKPVSDSAFGLPVTEEKHPQHHKRHSSLSSSSTSKIMSRITKSSSMATVYFLGMNLDDLEAEMIQDVHNAGLGDMPALKRRYSAAKLNRVQSLPDSQLYSVSSFQATARAIDMVSAKSFLLYAVMFGPATAVLQCLAIPDAVEADEQKSNGKEDDDDEKKSGTRHPRGSFSWAPGEEERMERHRGSITRSEIPESLGSVEACFVYWNRVAPHIWRPSPYSLGGSDGSSSAGSSSGGAASGHSSSGAARQGEAPHYFHALSEFTRVGGMPMSSAGSPTSDVEKMSGWSNTVWINILRPWRLVLSCEEMQTFVMKRFEVIGDDYPELTSEEEEMGRRLREAVELL